MGRDIGTSLRMSQDQQNYWLIIYDKFEDLLQQLHRCQDVSHKDTSA